MDFNNTTSTQWHYLVAVEIRDPNGNVVYDSNTEGENRDGNVSGHSSDSFGSYDYTLPDNAPTGTYDVVASLRQYPWDPDLDWRGLAWCPPEETFVVSEKPDEPAGEITDIRFSSS